MKKVVFLTGATGFLGTQIAQRLIKTCDVHVVVLVRGKDFDDAHEHLSRAWWEWPELLAEIRDLKKYNHNNGKKSKIYLVKGDITEEKLGLDTNEYNFLVHNVTHIIHTAADLRLNIPLEDLRRVNVQGTSNLLELAFTINKDHKIARFSHLSTAYVAGGQKDIIFEDVLTDEYGFLSNYERSKYEGELEVKNSNLPISIFRPGMVIGDSESGYIKTFNTIYVLLRIYLNKQLKLLPVSKKSKINIVPVDYVAESVVELTFNCKAEGKIFHLTAPYTSIPTIEDFLDFVHEWSLNNMNLNIPQPIFLPVPSLIPKISQLLKYFGKNAKSLSKILKELAPYLNEDREFSRNNTEKLLKPYPLHWKKFLPKILEYAVYNGFFHRSERTVHEQVIFRLKSKNKAVKYYDIMNGKFHERNKSNVRNDILRSLNSLKNLGIVKGDKIAIMGFNSSRYLILDVSIGLLGAISVPLYYTSPVNEINEILKNCGAKLIFVGTPDLLNHLKEVEIGDNIISFCSDDIEVPSNILSWKEFMGNTYEDEKNFNDIVAPVDFEDIATIRYTSGTTGDPSGVTFTHGNLRWMAEYIASMPPWDDRNHEVSYLSFLPMNHVVEGILGTYAPYYAPAPLKLFFLEDFKDLETSLPKVRPTIFFSVPRFYEKIWSKILQSKLGSMYDSTNNGVVKEILRIILRRSILKQAGLDACAQLIVGSAPVSTELLRSYNELGIQIYNAYGLTEAPLITINRLGSNRIGTVGEPLPNTNVKINNDGEIMVNGPQVTSGYFNNENRNYMLLQNNWLFTGDYGYLTPEKSLVITGRKKELIVNSYGKSISTLKIEGLLKHINGVTEVMVVGDEKPYCIALIWVNENVEPYKINTAMRDVNLNLSHPEKIKRWVMLKNDLSIKNGDLTPNLKLKRENILKRHQHLVDIIYKDNFPEEISGESIKMKLFDFGWEGVNNEY